MALRSGPLKRSLSPALGRVFMSAMLVGAPLAVPSASAQEGAAEQAPSATAEKEKRSKLGEILKSWFGDSDEGENDLSEGADGGGSITGLEDGAEVYSPVGVLTEEELKTALPWRAPDFKNQVGALGWNEAAFNIPAGMESRVAFWRDIYSKYTTDQGVLHDTVHVEIVYAPVDFTAIMQDKSTTLHQKAKAREKLVDEKRKEITERLRRLHGRSSAAGLSGEDLRVWKLFERMKDENKFLDAAEKGRVRFQLGQKDKFILGIYYSGRYLREMEKIFKEEGLPIELTRLPFVESSFNIHARSRVGASGVWQFMPRTAKPFMKVGKDVDERNDPIRATRASARVLRQNYMMLEAWPLAVTGYNHGPYGVKGITNKLGTRNLAEIIARYSSRTFGFASENFYACFLAALEIERNAKKYFGDVKWSPEVPGRELKTTRPVQFASLRAFFDGDEDATSLMNPHLTARVRSGKALIPQGTFIRVPDARYPIAESFMRGKIESSKLASAVQAVPLPRPTPVAQTVVVAESKASASAVDKVESGTVREKIEKLSAAAAAILPVLSGKEIPESAKPAEPIVIPVASQAGTTQSPEPMAPTENKIEQKDETKTEVSQVIEPVGLRTHKVRPGENLIRIAKKYGVGLQELKKLNKLEGTKRKSTIKVGQTLSIPSAEAQEEP